MVVSAGNALADIDVGQTGLWLGFAGRELVMRGAWNKAVAESHQ